MDFTLKCDSVYIGIYLLNKAFTTSFTHNSFSTCCTMYSVHCTVYSEHITAFIIIFPPVITYLPISISYSQKLSLYSIDT